MKSLEKKSDHSKTTNEKFDSVSEGNDTVKSSYDSKTRYVRRLDPSQMVYNPVAFYAYVSHDFGGIGLNEVILYDTVVTNEGNGYIKHTGVFTAPSTGLYAFCYTAFASGRHAAGDTGEFGEVDVQLLHNGVYKGSIHVDTEVIYDDEMSTGFAILMLQAGDVVLTMSEEARQGSYSSNRRGRWSFSGFKIY